MEPFKRFTMTRRDCRWWKSRLLLDGRRLEMLMELRVGFVIDFVFLFFEKVVGFFLALHSVVWGVRDSMHLHGTWNGMAWHGMMKKMMMIRSQQNHLHCI